MFFFIAMLMTLFLVLILLGTHKSKHFVAVCTATCLIYVVLGMNISMLNVPIALVLLGCGIVWHESTRRSMSVLVACCLIMPALVYGCHAWWVWTDITELRRHFIEVPMSELAPPAKQKYAVSGLNEVEQRRLQSTKWEIEGRIGENSLFARLTPQMIEQLHSDTLKEFINSPGFGNPRMQSNPNRFVQRIYREQKREPVPFATDAALLSAESTQPGEPEPVANTVLDGMHTKGVVDFVNPLGFGLMRERKRVTGFAAHGFSQTPEATGWQIRTVELVGLLMHKEPVVYVSKNLPRMDELVKAPTRPLDPLEAHGLAKLVAGEDYYATNTPDGLRMVGAIRSVEQCQKCHGGGQGDLLGAFSYRLAPAK
jgi:hypothetical protein